MSFFRSLKFRFVFILVLFMGLLCTFTAFINVLQTSKTVSRIFAGEGVALVERAVAAIDGGAFEKLAASGSMEDSFYVDSQRELHTIKTYSDAKYLYSMAPSQGDMYIFVIDGSDVPGGEEFSALGNEEDISGYDPAFFRCIETRETAFGDMMFQEDWGWLISIYSPIFNTAGDMVGIMGCDYDAEGLHSAIVNDVKRQILFNLGFVALSALFTFFFLRIIFVPLKKINTILKNISSGEGDLTKSININKNDEIGELALYFNLTLEKIKNLVVVIKEKSVSLHTVGNELAGNMEQTASSVNQITTNIQSIKSKVLSQSASITEANTTMRQVTGNIEKLNLNVESQTESVSRSSSAIEEMLANIQSVAQTLLRNEENITELAGASEEGRSSLDEVSVDIREIARESEGLLEINEVMQNISSQTNLLSMNAAIEAAHAGEAGKGFAVVADEIRKLAENSADQSKTIADVLTSIKGSIDKITSSTGDVLKKFQAINEKVRIVSEQEEQIRCAMEEQGQGSRQILEAVSTLNEVTRLVKTGSSDMMIGSREVVEESKNLEFVTHEITNGMNEMGLGAVEINEAVNQINDISRTNRENIDALVAEVSRFKVG